MNHDIPPGPLTHCQITGSTDLFEIIDLGHQPLCDSLLTAEQLQLPEVTYPLKLMMCPKSGLAQLSYVVDGSTVYHPKYPYRSGISHELAVYQRAFAADVCDRLQLGVGSLVVDIGSNDGTLLSGFKKLGMRVLGVEPTDIWMTAYNENDVDTLNGRFTEENANFILGLPGLNSPAQLITATNVFAHMADLGEVMRGIQALLAPDGVFITESHYLLDVLEKNQFDTIYHEHIRTYSLRSLVKLFEQYDMEVFDVQRADRYGGNIRAYVARRGTKAVSPAVDQLLQHERDVGLFDELTWQVWRNQVWDAKSRFMDWLIGRHYTSLDRVWGKACPGRCITLMNFYGIQRYQMPYIAELPTSLKLGMYTPGNHIPVVTDDDLLREQPDYAVILAWHYSEPIMRRLKEAGYRGKFVLPLPEFQIID
jgi:SAM-dependent methyltransferase